MRKSVLFLSIAAILAVPVHATRQPVRARHGMVVAMEAIATDVGVSVLQKGGNAVDAAVAVGFAMAVTHPFAGITYFDRTESAPHPAHMHVVQIDLEAPGLRFKVSPPADSPRRRPDDVHRFP